jgi:uncharacterized protein DUF6916
MTLDDFEPLVGRTFEVRTGEKKVEIVLLEAIPIGSPSAVPQSSFSLLFRGPLDTVLEQRTYTLEETSLGALEVFLVPVGEEERGWFLYEAVFD